MVKLTESQVLGRTRATDIENVRKLNCWGNELDDIQILQYMTHVQIVSLSVNNITTLRHFVNCENLEELYIRKNEIASLSEILHLKNLPKLRVLWLADNPCAVGDRYRLTVLRTLPNLQKLDNLTVSPDEINLALENGQDLLNHECRHQGYESTNYMEEHSPSRFEQMPAYSHSSSSQENEMMASAHAASLNSSNGSAIYTQENHTSSSCSSERFPLSCRLANSAPRYCSREEPIIENSEKMSRRHSESSILEEGISLSLEETNKIRTQLGLKSLPIEHDCVVPSRSGHRSRSKRNKNSNLLQAALCLVQELDAMSLEVVADAVDARLEVFRE